MHNLPSKLSSFLWHFLSRYKWLLLSTFIIASFTGLYGNMNSYITKSLIDTVENNNADLLKKAMLPASIFVTNFVLHSLAWRVIDYINMKVAPKIKNDLIESLVFYLHTHSFRFFQDNLIGSVTSNINRLEDFLEDLVTSYLPHLTRGFVQLALAIVSMWFIHPMFSIALAVWVALFLKVSMTYSKKISGLSDAYAESHAEVSGKITDSLTNNANVRLFARKKFEIEYLYESLKEMARKYCQRDKFMLKIYLIQGLSITILITIMISGLLTLRMRGAVTVGDFAFILGLTLYVAENIWWITERIDKINDSIGHCNQALNYLIISHEIEDKQDAANLVVTRGEIVFDNVVFNYKNNKNLFENNSIIIEAGQKLGLVGYSGSGKSSFVNLIVRLFDVASGRIIIDGQDISSVTQESLRENIGVIPQDPTLFHRSLMENIRYGRINATDEEVIEAAKKAHAHEFIIETSNGYDTLAGERGVKLSGGQRQRIAVARAILKNAPILILDEATSALDSVTEGYIQHSLSELMNGKTVLVIAHRLSTLLNMDRILVFDQGVIVEDGQHNLLLAKHGRYAKLWNNQVGGFLLDNKQRMFA